MRAGAVSLVGRQSARVAAALLLLLALPAQATRLPRIFSDHMMLQSGRSVPIWGWGDPGEAVTIRFAGQSKVARTGADGRWRVELAPLKPSAKAQTLTVTGKDRLAVSDVLVGEVWLASGQSNMEKPLGDQPGQKPTFGYQGTIAGSTDPQLRFFRVKVAPADRPADDVGGEWVVSSPEALVKSGFSAVGYHFAHRIHAETGQPVGVIGSYLGGTRIEPWTPPTAFATELSLAAFAEAARTPGTRVNRIEVSTLYNGMLAPLAGYAIRGALWYQGESNLIGTDDGPVYADKMVAMVRGWRQAWGQGDFPFYFVQIAPWLYRVYYRDAVASTDVLPRLQEAQTAAWDRIPHSGMVVISDLVDDINELHPRDKADVAERLARWALANEYGHKDLVTSGPRMAGISIDGATATVRFRTAGRLVTSDGRPPNWFTIGGADGRMWPAYAVIENDSVRLTSPNVPHPTVVRFAWDEAAQSNLFNTAGLPAVPFRSDTPTAR